MRVDTGAQGAIEVTPSDTVNIAFPTGTTESTWVYVGVAGAIKALMADGTTATFTNLLAGVMYPLAIKKVFATGTVATGVIALY